MRVEILPKYRCAHDSKRPLERATWDDVLKYGGNRLRERDLLPPIAGGALSLVNSGSVTPTVGVNNTVATDTPSLAQMYVVEVNLSAMQASDAIAVGVRRISTGAPTVTFRTQSNLTVASVFPAITPTLAAVASGWGATPLTPGIPSDSQGNTWAAVVSTNGVGIFATNPKPRFDAALQADWFNDQIGLGPAYLGAIADTLAGGSGWNTYILGPTTGVSWGYGLAYGMATATSTSVTTSSDVNAGDLVLAAAVASNSTTGAQPGGWIGAAGSGSAVGWQIAGSTGPVTYNPSGPTFTHLAIAALPTITGRLLGKAAFRGIQGSTNRQSIPFLVNAGEQVAFDVFQMAGTARSIPWRLWHL